MSITNDVPVSRLSNPIHPIFSLRNFPNGGIVRESILSALQLASHLIELDGVLPLWHLLFFASARLERAQPGEMGRRFSLYTDTSFTKQRYKRATREAFISLSGMVTFRFEDQDALGAQCNAQPHVPGRDSLRGCGSVITIASRWLRELQYAINARDRHQEAALNVRLASVLVHELAHAARIAGRWTTGRDQYYLPGRSTSEEGCEIEAAIFGGRIWQDLVSYLADTNHGSRCYRTGTRKVLLLEWPMPSTVACYDNYRQDKSIYRGEEELPPYNRAWELSAASLHDLLQDTFWEHVAERGIKALHPQRGPYWYYQMVGSQEWICGGLVHDPQQDVALALPARKLVRSQHLPDHGPQASVGDAGQPPSPITLACLRRILRQTFQESRHQ